MRSIKTKLITAISILVIFLFSVTALLLIDEKTKELSHDIYVNARNFSELTTPKIADLYKSLLAEKSFVIFNKEVKDIFRKNVDISKIRLATYGGSILYDSVQEKDRSYEGEARQVADPDLKARLQRNLPSYLLKSGRTVYLKKDSEGNYIPVNENEKEAAPIADTDKIENLVFPLPPNYSAVFDVTYENLNARVLGTTKRIVLLLVFGILLGLGFGWVFSGKITGPIEKLKEGALIIGKGDFKARVIVKTRDEVGVLAETFNKMAQDLEISTKAMIEKERMSKELEVAARIQKQILPATLPQISGLDIAATVIPATEIGGDCYDFIQVDPDTNIIYISDVTGHGIPSGIVVSIANAIIYSYAKSSSLSEILVNANRVLKNKTAQNMFMTLLMLRYQNGSVSYMSAGHPEMLHYFAADKKVSTEKGGGIALGMIPDNSKMLTESTMSFEKGDSIILYSDGIPEAVSERGDMYGLQRFKRALNDCGELANAEAIKSALIADVKQFMGNAPQADDITMVVLRKV